MCAAHEEPKSSTPEAARAVPRGLLASIGRELQTLFEDRARALRARVHLLAASEGVDGLYVDFVLTRPSSGWPPMRLSDREALEIVSRMLNAYAAASADAQLQVPASEGELGVDRTLRRLATWTRGELVPELKREYLGVIDRHCRTLIELAPAGEGAPAEIGVSLTMQVMQEFEAALHDDRELRARRSLTTLIDRLFA